MCPDVRLVGVWPAVPDARVLCYMALVAARVQLGTRLLPLAVFGDFPECLMPFVTLRHEELLSQCDSSRDSVAFPFFQMLLLGR